MYKLGKPSPEWKSGIAKDITFVLTEDCNLRCRYCYICGKNSTNKMTFEVAKKAVDFLLDHPELFPEDSVVFNFIGGEPFLEIELADQITDYIKVQMFKKGHKWFKSHMFNFSTNGIMYHLPSVQRYIKKHKERLSIGISIDGNKIKHDLQRVYPDGRGSYDDVIKNVPLWLSQFPNSGTKATFSSDDLPYLKDSIISLWENGISTVNANVVFEDVWKEGDDLILEEQLKLLADYAIENDLFKDYNCSFFSESIGNPYTSDELERNWCGAGKMLAIDCKGNFYPCVRFIQYSLTTREAIKIGDIYNGLDLDKIRPFFALTVPAQSSEVCLNCEVASGCAWCQGWNYDSAETRTIYQRSTAICKMHKARVRANNYYWRRLESKKNIENTNGTYNWKKHLFIIMSDDAVEHCHYNSKKECINKISDEIFKKAIRFAELNFFRLIILKSKSGYGDDFLEVLNSYSRLYIDIPKEKKDIKYTIDVYYNTVDKVFPANNSIFKVDKEYIFNIAKSVKKLLSRVKRVNLILPDPKALTEDDIKVYETQLAELTDFLVEQVRSNNEVEINVLSDRLILKEMANCNAGFTSFAIGPNGKLYICPAYYFEDPDSWIGDLDSGIHLKNQHLYTLKYAPICQKCDCYHCRRCIYLNQKYTLEVNTPTHLQCKISHLERKYSQILNERLKELGIQIVSDFKALDYDDPIVLFDKK
jgi:radical SAM peptide maturase (CXXX-repeat target family)/CXXX repeat peptide maturase